MMLSLRAVLLAVLAAGFLHVDAQAQTSDRAALLPPPADVTGALPIDTGKSAAKAKQDGKLTLQSGRDSEMGLESGVATRREILDRLFAGREVEIVWRNKAFADERVHSGGLNGPPIEVARRLLARQSYVMSYDNIGDEPRLARIVILGSDSPSVTQSAAAAPVRVRQEVPMNDFARKRAAIDAAKRAITDAQRR
jgi:hypothetical protein